MNVPVRVKRLHPDAKLPYKATEAATGYDLYAYLPKQPVNVVEVPVQIPTGIALQIELGFDVQIRPRSGLSSRGVIVMLGTIDADYRGELLVTMYALPGQPHTVEHGDRIAQLVVSRVMTLDFLVAEDLSETARGAGGHGSTGR